MLAYLENVTGGVELTCKVSGDRGKGTQLKDEGDFEAAIQRLCQKAGNARSHPASMEIRNIAKARHDPSSHSQN